MSFNPGWLLGNSALSHLDTTLKIALLLSVAGIVLMLVLARPPRCPACGLTAVSAEEYELSSTPRIVAITDRCPRCGDVVARRTIGAFVD